MDTNDNFLRFSEEGQEIFRKWLTDLQQNRLSNQDDHPVIIEHLAKYRSLMPSLALIFHLIDTADKGAEPNPVSGRAASMAAAWCEYLESHARRIYSLAIDANQTGAAKLAMKLKSKKLKDEFTRPDVVRKNWGMLTKKEQVQDAIDHLLELNWLRVKTVNEKEKKGGRPPATIYQVNPKIFYENTNNDTLKPPNLV